MPTRRTFMTTAVTAALTAGLGAPLAPRAARASDAPIKLRTLYDRKSLSQTAKDSAGHRIAVEGYMAPPLKAESRFFVLTRRPMAVCPFCETEADWPNDILAVYTKRILTAAPYNVKIVASGVLDLDPFKDPETGFLSMVRLTDATVG